MTTATLETYSLSSVLDAPTASDGTDLIVRGLKVFKVGAFKNSKGHRNEWTAERLQRAVDNFNTLRRTRIFPDVPVRIDHTSSMRDVVGYFHELHFDGQFLVADVLFTKRSAHDEYVAGHLRNVSLEIGQYETNDEAVYDDVVQGLAFVDIPAVEGLHQRASGDDDMAVKAETETPVEPDPVVPDPVEPPAEPEPVPVPQPDEAKVDAHQRPAVQTFRVNGAESSDVATVQAHIDSLEKFRSDMRSTIRDTFVDDLVKQGKILGPQVESFKAHAASLSDVQFEAFRTMYDGMPAHNLLAKHDTTTDPAVASAQDTADELAIAKEVIQQFRRANRSQEFIEKTPQWALVQAALNGTSK
jgi:hypothetical protein